MRSFFAIIISSLLYLGLAIPARSADCFSAASGNLTINPGAGGSCTLPLYTDGNSVGRFVAGTDGGELTAQTGSVTINSNTTVILNKLNLTGGTLILAQGAQIRVGSNPIWGVDTDADGYPAHKTVYVQTSAPTGGRRLNAITNFASTADCNDANANIYRNITSLRTDKDQDSYPTTAAASTHCVGAQTTHASGRVYYRSISGNFDLVGSGSVSATNDCLDTNASIYFCNVEVLVVGGGGGGGGGGSGDWPGGGGGAGGMRSSASLSLPAGSHSVVVGNGGGGGGGCGTCRGGNGGDSSFYTITSTGGGGGGAGFAGPTNGGSGGGGAGEQNGAAGISGQGNNGAFGEYVYNGPNWHCGGGGGAGSVGFTGAQGSAGGTGGSSSITGVATTYARGGNGGLWGNWSSNGWGGANNTGNGGNGANLSYEGAAAGGNGGSGIVVVRYPTGTYSASGGSITTSGGFTIHRFLSGSATFTINPI